MTRRKLTPEQRAEKKRRQIEASLREMRDRLPDRLFDDAEVDVFVNADLSVDGQLRVRRLARDEDLQGLLIDLEAAAKAKHVGRAWMSVGVRFPHDAKLDREMKRDPDRYSRWRGLLTAMTYSQRMTEGNVPIHFLAAREKVVKGLEARGRRRPTELLIKVGWRQEGDRPPIDERLRGKGGRQRIKKLTKKLMRELRKGRKS